MEGYFERIQGYYDEFGDYICDIDEEDLEELYMNGQIDDDGYYCVSEESEAEIRTGDISQK